MIDYVSVNENAAEPPETTDGINSADALKAEATMLQKSFRKVTSGDEGLVRYRKVDLGGVCLVYRADVHARVGDGDDLAPEQLVNTYVVNEFDYKSPGAGGSFEWRKKLVGQRGAVIATEMKNNSNKLCRFMTEAVLAGVGITKVGYVSRKSPKDRKVHQVLMTTTNLPEEFMANMAYDVNTGFGVLKAVGDVLMGFEDGKYVVVRDPVKPMLVVYQM
jgi:translation initiation factor 3 subunit D